MANDRETSKQKRARENRARREALVARTQAAGTPRPSRAAPAASSRAKGAKVPLAKRAAEESTEDGGQERSTGRRPARTRKPRPGDHPVDVATLEGSFLRRLSQVPGGTQVLSGVLVSLLSTACFTYIFLKVNTLPAEGQSIDDKDVDITRTVYDVSGLGGFVPLAVIMVLVLGGLALSLTKHRRRVWIVVAATIALFVAQGLILYLFAAGMFGYAAFRASKVEGPAEPFLAGVLARRKAARGGAGDGGDDAGEDAADDGGDDAPKRPKLAKD